MTWQHIIVLLLVLVSAWFVGKRMFSRFFKKKEAGCSSGCSSCPMAPKESKLS